MPYTKAPEQSTYETKRVSLVADLQQRSGALPNKDFRLVNMFVEKITSPINDNKRYFIKSRPGMSPVVSLTPGTAGRGVYYWYHNGGNFIVSVLDNKLYNGTTLVDTIDTSTGVVGWTEYIDDTGTNVLLMSDGTNLYKIVNTSGSTLVMYKTVPTTWVTATAYTLDDRVKPTVSNNFFYKVTTAGTSGGAEPVWPTTEGATIVDGTVTWTCYGGSIPVPHIPNPIFLDGYVFLGKVNSQDIYNSNLNDPRAWTAGDFISAEMYPDTLQALSKNNNYIYAIGRNSVEYFSDIANATGSPLGRQAGAVLQFGTAAPNTVVQTEKEVLFIGETGNGGHTVWLIDGFKAKEIAIPAVTAALVTEGSSISSAVAYVVRVSGQKLYIINLTSRTFVYSFDNDMWHEWASSSNSRFYGYLGTDGPNGTPYVQTATGGAICALSEAYFTDNTGSSVPFTCSITTSKLDFDVINRKFMSRFSLIGDIPSESDDTLNTFSVQWSDDDYKTWTTARNLILTYDFPSLTQLGQFRRRAFKISISPTVLIRLEGIEVDINKGQQ